MNPTQYILFTLLQLQRKLFKHKLNLQHLCLKQLLEDDRIQKQIRGITVKMAMVMKTKNQLV